jgi:hypothetical protein
MGDAAHAESLDHEVYRAPFAVQPEFESWDTPDNYRFFHVGPDKLPDKMKVWLVQKLGKKGGGVVAYGEGFTDSPDAEILVLGFNSGKPYGSVGVGRHGNFLQWGYSAPPSQMTEAGRRLFLNCIHYIHRFDGKAPLVHDESSPRTDVLPMARSVNQGSGDARQSFLRSFPEALYERYHADPDGLMQYYRENLEWVYRDRPFRPGDKITGRSREEMLKVLQLDRVFKVDEELKELGIDSNRRVATVQRLIELLDDSQRGAVAKKLLSRYTDQSFDTPQQWRQWFDEIKDRLYFSDVGGYKFVVVPEGYPVARNSRTGTSESPSR